jgi:hypothetical protein
MSREEATEALREGSGGAVKTQAPDASWEELLSLCDEAGYNTDDLASVGRYVAAGVPWIHVPRVTIGYLCGGRNGRGAILEQLVAEAEARDARMLARPKPRAVQPPPAPKLVESPEEVERARRKAFAWLEQVRAERRAQQQERPSHAEEVARAS